MNVNMYVQVHTYIHHIPYYLTLYLTQCGIIAPDYYSHKITHVILFHIFCQLFFHSCLFYNWVPVSATVNVAEEGLRN